MAEIQEPVPVKLIVGALSRYSRAFEMARLRMVGRFGPVDIESDLIPFTFTEYYAGQMGINLLRKFFAFERLVDPGILPDVKVWTNRMEAEIGAMVSIDVPRPLNLDPGYLTLAKVVLASTKDFAHRVYLREGIYGEVTLQFEKGGTLASFPWTFPDFKSSPDYHAFLFQVRQKHAQQLKRARPA